MTRRNAIITLLGPDRSGIVAELAKAVAEVDGNWERSELSRLANHFAGIISVTIDADKVSELRSALAKLATGEMVIEMKVGEDENRGHLIHRVLSLTATDRVGIVERIAGTLAKAAANVDSLETHVEDAPHAGGQLFRARFEVSTQTEAAVVALASQLEQIAPDIMVDFES